MFDKSLRISYEGRMQFAPTTHLLNGIASSNEGHAMACPYDALLIISTLDYTHYTLHDSTYVRIICFIGFSL